MSETYHGGDLVHALQEFNNLGLVGRLHAGEKTGAGNGGLLLSEGQVVKFAARVGLASGILLLGEDANAAADSLSGGLVVASDDNDTDTSSAATDNGVEDLLAGRVKHATDTDEAQVVL
jgi:hypothetical protein